MPKAIRKPGPWSCHGAPCCPACRPLSQLEVSIFLQQGRANRLKLHNVKTKHSPHLFLMTSTCNNDQSPTLLIKGILWVVFFQKNTRISQKPFGAWIVIDTLGISEREKVLMRFGESRALCWEWKWGRSRPFGNLLACSNLWLQNVYENYFLSKP